MDFSQSVAKLWSQYRRKDNQNGRGKNFVDLTPFSQKEKGRGKLIYIFQQLVVKN